jgi:hypothetical protein
MNGKRIWLSAAITAAVITLGGCVAETGDDEEQQQQAPTVQPATGQVTPTVLPQQGDTSGEKGSDPPVPSSVQPEGCGTPGDGNDPEPSPWAPVLDPRQQHGY